MRLRHAFLLSCALIALATAFTPSVLWLVFMIVTVLFIMVEP